MQQYVVTYCRSVDIDVSENEDAYDAAVKVLCDCVKGYTTDPVDTASSAVLLSISTMGVKLTNMYGNNVVTCPLDKVLYNFLSDDDGRYFGFLTDPSNESSVSSSVSSYSNNYEMYSCHVLMVDSRFANHATHEDTASVLGITCKQILSGCQQFPHSPAVILDELNSFYKTRNFFSHYSPSSFGGSSTLGRPRVNSIDQFGRPRGNSVDQSPLSLDRHYASQTPKLSTPDKQIISSTLERIRGHAAYSSTPRDAKKLMISPPSSLTGVNDEEEKQLLNELEQRKQSQSTEEGDDSPPRVVQLHGKNDSFRRKSTSELELFGTSSGQGKIVFSGTNSIGAEHRKPPPAPQRLHVKNTEPALTLFQGFKRSGRRRSDNPQSQFSPKAGIRDLFFKSSSKNRKSTSATTPPPQSVDGEKSDVMRQFPSISSSTSDQSLEVSIFFFF